MSKSGKLKKKRKRLEVKRARKAAYKALAESRRGDANSKRNQRKDKKRKRFSLKKHDMANCGNAGCRRCHPDSSRPKYPNKVFSRLAREARKAA